MDVIRQNLRLTPYALIALFLAAGSAAGDPLVTATSPDGALPAESAKTESDRPSAPQSANPETPPASPEPPKADASKAEGESQAAPEVKPEAQPAPPENLASVKPDEALGILGKKVRGPDGKDVMGPVVDVLVDAEGRPRAAVIDFGGFIGVGSRKIAVDWQLLKFRPADHDAPLMLSLDRAEIQAAPEYKESAQPAEVVEPPLAAPASSDAGK